MSFHSALQLVFGVFFFYAGDLYAQVVDEQASPASSPPAAVTRSSLEGLSREALINLILGGGKTPTAPAGGDRESTRAQDWASNGTHTDIRSGNKSFSYLETFNPDEKFYLYPLDKKYWWRWPDHNSSCTAHNQIGHNHAMNSGQPFACCMIVAFVQNICLYLLILFPSVLGTDRTGYSL